MSGNPSTVKELRTDLVKRFPQACVGLEMMEESVSGFASERAFAAGLITEVVAEVGAGGCSLVLKHMADLLASNPGRYGAFIDGSGQLYPPAVAAMGIPLHRLILIRPDTLITALKAVELLVVGGGVRMIVLDLPADTAPVRLSAVHRLRRMIRKQDVALALLVRHVLVPADCRIALAF
jgi:RecA/RadA recombinase